MGMDGSPRACANDPEPGFESSGFVGEPYFIAPGGTGTFAPWHFPLPVLLPARRPLASRWVLVKDPAVLPLVAVVPASRPEASRNCVVVPEPLPVRVSALPAKRPMASR